MSPWRAVRLLKKKKWGFLLLAAVLFLVRHQGQWGLPPAKAPIPTETQSQWRDGRMLEVEGTVIKLLPTDNSGSRHQRWLMQTPQHRTLLVAHNIDLAPFVPLNAGDKVRVFGQFEANSKGGLLHWTHADPAGRHTGGWIRHKGRIYD